MNALSWIAGVFLTLAGLGGLATSPVAGLLILVAAAIVLPPVNDWLKSKLNVVFSAKVKAWAVLALLVGSGLYEAFASAAVTGRKRETAEQVEQRRIALRSEFENDRPAILKQLDSALAVHNYPQARAIGDKYAGAVSDSGFLRRFSAILAAQKREHDLANERRLLVRATSTPAGNLEENRDVYQQLMVVNPSNATYKAKFDDYSSRIRQQQTRARQEQAVEQDRIRRFGPMPHRYSTGVYDEVELYLKSAMRDPSSLEGLECTPVYHIDKGWLVGCNYRGRNGFGGMNREANWFVIRQERVVEVLPFSAYKP